jgi:hypothetical protein
MARIAPAIAAAETALLNHGLSSGAASAGGIVKQNVEPAPCLDSTQILPPYLSTILWQIASPIPVPS